MLSTDRQRVEQKQSHRLRDFDQTMTKNPTFEFKIIWKSIYNHF